MVDNIVVAGKNNIAIDVTNYLLGLYPHVNFFFVTNKNDIGVDGFQRSFKKYISDNKLIEISLGDAQKINNAIFLSLEFDQIIKPERFNYDALYNIHFSLLPKYKGMYTSAWPIINAEEYSGVTLHEIDSGIDTGNIIAQSEFTLSANETAKSLYEKYIFYGTDIVINNLNKLVSGSYEAIPQGSYQSSYYSKSSISYRKVFIDLNKTAYEVKKQFLAFTFRDYQLPHFDCYAIFGVDILDEKSTKKPGSIIKETSKYYQISTVDYDCVLYKDSLDEMLDACRTGDIKSLTSLASNGQLINEKNENGWSPIIVAAFMGHIEVIKFLLSLGADINDRNYKGTTTLMYAKDYLERTGDCEFLEELIKLGANPSLKDNRELSVYDYVSVSDNEYSTKFFGKH